MSAKKSKNPAPGAETPEGGWPGINAASEQRVADAGVSGDRPTLGAVEEWQRTFDAVSDPIAILDTDYRIVRVNAVMAERLGLSKDACVGQMCYRAVHGSDEPPSYCPNAQLLRDGQPHTAEICEKRLGGDFLVTVSPLRDSLGKLVGSVHLARDVTEWKKRGFALQELRAKLATLAETTHEGIGAINRDGIVSFANHAFAQLLGYEQKELVGCHPKVFVGPEEYERFAEVLARKELGDVGRFEGQFRAKDGSLRHVIVHTSPLHDEDGTIRSRILLVTDVTERTRAEDALKSSEQRLRILFESAPDAYYLSDLKGTFLGANRAAEQLVGYDKRELLGKSFLHPSVQLLSLGDVPRAVALLTKNVLGRPTGPDEFVVNTKSGGRVPVEIRTFPVTIEGRSMVLGIARDITERKRTEEMVRRAERMEMEKLAVTGRMAAQVAHEINNPLAGIKNSFRLIKDAVPEDHPNYDMVARIDREIDRIAHVVRQMYKLYSPRAQQPSDIAVEEAIRDVVVMLEPLGQEHEVTIELGAIAPRLVVHIPEGSLQQILYNLTANAIQASPSGGTVSIRAEAADRGQVRISIGDEGPGIPQEVQERMFEPFFSAETGDSVEDRIGLGLSIVKGIVTALNGRIEFESKFDEGTCFHIYLPSE